MKHLVPRSHKFQAYFSLSQRSNRDHSLQRELPTTGKANKLLRTVAADSQVVNCNRFSYQQVIHILPPTQAPKVLDLIGHNCLAPSIPNQCSLLDRCIYDSVQDKPVFPSTQGGGVLDCKHTFRCAFNFQPPRQKITNITRPNASN